MTPQTGIVGSQITLTITYDAPQAQTRYKILWSQSLLFADAETILLKEGLIPSGASSVTVQIIVPESGFGVHFIRFVPETGSETNFQFSVLPHLSANPLSAMKGSTVSVRGDGFPAQDEIIFKIDNRFLETRITTNNVGSFSGKVQVPDLPAGYYKLTAINQLISLSTSVTLEIKKPVDNDTNNLTSQNNDKPEVIEINSGNTAPVNSEKYTTLLSMPAAKSPAGDSIGTIGSQLITIQWTDVNNTTKVTYEVEVSESHDFSSTAILTKTGLTESNFTVVLEPGIYYWRVKAVDGAGNESHWSYAPYAFRVSELSITLNKLIDVIKENNAVVLLVFIAIASFFILNALASFIRSLLQRKE